MRSRALIVATVVGGLTLLLAAAAMAAAGWSTPQRLSGFQAISNGPAVDANADNVTVAAWYRYKNHARDQWVRASIRARSGPFSPAVTLGPAKMTIGANPPSFPSAAVDRRGDAAVAWLQKDAQGKLRAVVAYRPANGRFGAPQVVSPAGFDSFQPRIAVNARGDFTVVWQRFDSGLFQVQAATRRSGGRRFGAPTTLSSPRLDSEFPHLGVASNGRIVVAWRAKDTHTRGLSFVQAVSRGPAGKLGRLAVLSDRDLDADIPVVATAPNGKTMVVWQETNQTTVEHVGAAFFAGGTFGHEQVLAPIRDHSSINPSVGVDARGRAVIVWLEVPSPGKTGSNFIRWTSASATGRVGPPHTLYRADRLISPTLAVSPQGAAVAVWIREAAGTDTLLSAIRRAGGNVLRLAGAVTPAGTSGEAPDVTASAGSATAVWVARRNANAFAVSANHRSLK